jgi:hypothetical protein
MSKQEIGLIAIGLIFLYFFIKLLFDLLLRGFAPFIASRPWVIEGLLEELKKENIAENPTIYSLSCGKSGFLYFVGREYKGAKLVGVEQHFRPYIAAKIQSFIRFLGIKVIYQPRLNRLDFHDANIIYCYLSATELRDLPNKFKFECEPKTIIISIGLPIPGLQEKRVISISGQAGRFFFLSTKIEKEGTKPKDTKRAHYIYFYQI